MFEFHSASDVMDDRTLVRNPAVPMIWHDGSPAYSLVSKSSILAQVKRKGAPLMDACTGAGSRFEDVSHSVAERLLLRLAASSPERQPER